jgi:hypothetical protein
VGIWKELDVNDTWYLVLEDNGFGIDYYIDFETSSFNCEKWKWKIEDGRIITTGEKKKLLYTVNNDTLHLVGWGTYIKSELPNKELLEGLECFIDY